MIISIKSGDVMLNNDLNIMILHTINPRYTVKSLYSNVLIKILSIAEAELLWILVGNWIVLFR
jgi:hypothetical protein